MRKALLPACGLALVIGTSPAQELKVRISWGHESPEAKSFHVRLPGIRGAAGYSLEAGEGLREGAWQTRAGGGDVDGVDLTLPLPGEPARQLQNLHVIWADLIAAADADTARRLTRDAAFQANPAGLRVEMNAEGTLGFSVTAGQLQRERALWIPSLDVYLAAGERPPTFAGHRKSLEAWKGLRILDRVEREPEAALDRYTSLWEDMGHPDYVNPQQRGPGHIVCLTWDSAIPKFGIDRGGGVWNDYGNPDKFRFWFGFADLEQGISRAWKSQRLADGLPVMTTVLEKDGVRYQLEQFAYPLEGPPRERRGDIAMLLLQKVRLTELAGQARTVPVTLHHRRQLPAYSNPDLALEERAGALVFTEAGGGRALFAIQGAAGQAAWSGVNDYQREGKRVSATVFVSLAARGSHELVVKLPSPLPEPGKLPALLELDYDEARAAALRFWSGQIARGAQFRVPEKAVNDLYRASLWHALRLPRRHGGRNARIDLPYSNFAYSQTGTPWPVNQAVYVDSMLYDLRGYHDISSEELLAIFRNNQEQDGHLNGVANWVVYTPGMLYAVAKNYLLSQDREAFDRLLPYTLKALDWCLESLRRAPAAGPAAGLVNGPLNDGTGAGVWAFNQAYLYAGLDLLGQALEQAGHPRAAECRQAARSVYGAIQREFGAASARSPLVQLRDHTWIPYVPCEVLTPRRLLEVWYPTDVDTGAVHLIRLKAAPARGPLADSLLNDHEDNLYLKGWGMANEPVYNQQATAYLLRDDVKAVIRAFYSYMASAFSHSQLEPVEHRWTHGQYFGPPSTSGAWFELYRHMLIHERDDGSLLIGQAAPRRWLEDGKKVEIERAPTFYGKLSCTIESQARAGRILADVSLAGPRQPAALLVRLRHPEAKPIRSATVNGNAWTGFDTRNEWVRIPKPDRGRYLIVATY